jgi:hypothetical protein
MFFLDSCKDKPLLYKRFLDDVVGIWTQGETALIQFFRDLNTIHRDLKFTYTFSKKSIDFLDITILFDQKNRKLSTDLFRKPTDRQAYLNFYSNHPRHVKNAIPVSVSNRIVKICSSKEFYNKNIAIFRQKLVEQQYPNTLIDGMIVEYDALNQNVSHDAEEIVSIEPNCVGSSNVTDNSDVVNVVDSTDVTRFITTFASDLPNVNAILRKHFGILKNSKFNAFVSPPEVTFRKAKNLGSFLVHSSLKNVPSPNSDIGDPLVVDKYPCSTPNRCNMCLYRIKSDSIYNSNNKFLFEINEIIACNDPLVVYLLVCQICNIQYVGQAKKFRQRWHNHKNRLAFTGKNPMFIHFDETGHDIENFRFALLKKCTDANHLNREEKLLIRRFEVITNGLNRYIGKN